MRQFFSLILLTESTSIKIRLFFDIIERPIKKWYIMIWQHELKYKLQRKNEN